MFERIFGPARTAASAAATAAELRGDLTEAIALFAKAGRPEEAARVLVRLGDSGERDADRMRDYERAIAMAPEGSALLREALEKRALLLFAAPQTAPMTRALRQELLRAARDLEASGAHARAAEAYARADDTRGRARALTEAGDVEALEALLARDVARSHDALAARGAKAEFYALASRGERRQAVAFGLANADEGVRELARSLALLRVADGRIHVTLGGRASTLVLGDTIVLGRAPDVAGQQAGAAFGAIAVASPRLSRSHLQITRRDSDVFVRDLGSRNGTRHHAGALRGNEVGLGAELELRLADDLVVKLRKDSYLPGAIEIHVAGREYIAPLRRLQELGVGAWRLESAPDGWTELITDDDPPAFARGIQLVRRTTLLVDDAIGTNRDDAPHFVVRKGPGS